MQEQIITQEHKRKDGIVLNVKARVSGKPRLRIGIWLIKLGVWLARVHVQVWIEEGRRSGKK